MALLLKPRTSSVRVLGSILLNVQLKKQHSTDSFPMSNTKMLFLRLSKKTMPRGYPRGNERGWLPGNENYKYTLYTRVPRNILGRTP